MKARDEINDATPRAGIGLALSGGGYRAALFHVGALLRLNEARLILQLRRVSSVSGGAIAAALLGLNWKKFDFQPRTANAGKVRNFQELIVDPMRRLTSETIDKSTGVWSLTPGKCPGDYVAGHYRRILFGDATLQDLPPDNEGPRIVINATGVQSGALICFSQPYMAEFRVGRVLNPRLPMAMAVAASSAFPPMLSPLTIELNPADFEDDAACPLQRHPYNNTWVLTDGSVADSLGLELETVLTRYRTLLVSDGGGKLDDEGSPAANWAEHSTRILEIANDRLRRQRKRDLIEMYRRGERHGAYWGICTDLNNYGLPATLRAPYAKTSVLAATPTRLEALPELKQNQLMNWGYAVSDAALRRHAVELLDGAMACPAQFPFSGGVG